MNFRYFRLKSLAETQANALKCINPSLSTGLTEKLQKLMLFQYLVGRLMITFHHDIYRLCDTEKIAEILFINFVFKSKA